MSAALKPIAFAVLTVAIVACGARRAADEGPAGGRNEVMIEVENQNFYDARVYMVEFGRRERLGSVPGNRSRTFSFRVQPGEIRFIVDFIGSGQITTDGIEISPGDELVLTVTAGAHRLRFRG